MRVRLQFYAQLRDLIKAESIDVDLADGATVSDLLQSLYATFPPLGAHDKTILVGAGVDFVDRDYVLKPADEVAIMPPVQGG